LVVDWMRIKSKYDQLEKRYPHYTPDLLMTMATSQLQIGELREALYFQPTSWQKNEHRITARRFAAIKHKINEAQLQGSDGIDDAMARRLIYLKTRLQWGRYVDQKNRQLLHLAVAEKGVSERELHDAISSLGGLTDRDGTVFSIHYPKWIDWTNLSAIICLCSVQLYCLAFIGTELFNTCRMCAVVGGSMMFFLALLGTEMLLTIGPRRKRAALLLQKIGVKPFDQRQNKKLADVARFFYLRLRLDDELKKNLLPHL